MSSQHERKRNVRQRDFFFFLSFFLSTSDITFVLCELMRKEEEKVYFFFFAITYLHILNFLSCNRLLITSCVCVENARAFVVVKKDLEIATVR